MGTWVAYLESDCSLVDVYCVVGMPSFGGLLAVAGDIATKRQRFQQVLIGQAAELLHIAITGRIDGCDPESAGVWIALRARQVLAGDLDAPGFAEAYAAVAQDFADFIRPFFGVTLLDERGRIVLDDERYDLRVDLPLVVGERMEVDGRAAFFGRN